MRIAIIGLTITSSWGNGHATVFRALVKALGRRGHDVTFLEHDKPWYAGDHRDRPAPEGCEVILYDSVEALRRRHARVVREADVTVVGSYVPEGIEVGRWAQETARRCCFYDIDTPVTLASLRRGECEYLSRELIRGYAIYFSFTGGATLDRLEREYGSRRTQALYCCVDPELYSVDAGARRDVDLGYMGTYSDDRQPTVERLLLEPARARPRGSFLLVGPQYPATLEVPGNVRRIEHLPPADHRAFYNRQRLTLNVTRRDMIDAGHAPSVRLFEAAACGTPIVSDRWVGIEEVLTPGSQIALADNAQDVLTLLDTDAACLQDMGAAARDRVLTGHTGDARAREFEEAVTSLA
jgi:spore maturation protein CgeB